MIAPATEDRLLVSVDEAARLMSVCSRTISRLCERGELHPIKIGPRGMRIAVADLQAWIAQQQREAQK